MSKLVKCTITLLKSKKKKKKRLLIDNLSRRLLELKFEENH